MKLINASPNRTTPYSEAGLKRMACVRCAKAAEHQWRIRSCAAGGEDTWRPLCTTCDVELNRMVLEFFQVAGIDQIMSAYLADVAPQGEPVKQNFDSHHGKDADGNPAGGTAEAIGIRIKWQKGPLGRGANRQSPNGAFVETVIAIAKDRLENYQASQFACEANAEAIEHLEAALAALEARTQEREEREVEGTHEV